MCLKKLSSLTIFIAILVMIYTGIILFIGPSCSIANWTNWELLGLTKAEYINIHTTFMLLFIIAMGVHLYYNLGPMLSYTKDEAKKVTNFTNELIMATLLSMAVFVGTLYEKSPFIELLDFGSELETAWEVRIEKPPFLHAELSSLLVFTKKMGYDLEKSKDILLSNNIKFREPQSLTQIAKQNDISPRFIYDLLRKNFEKEIVAVVQFAYINKKLIKDVATVLNMSSKEFLEKLKDMGLESKANEIFALESSNENVNIYKIVKKLGIKRNKKPKL